MKTNQTIDGVRRALLGNISVYLADSPNAIMRARAKELRALLDAPVHPCPVQLDGCDGSCTPAVQLQGQPVAYDIESAARKLAECMDYSWTHMPEQGRGAMREYVVAIVGAALSGNAEQPAPVAVVLPDQKAVSALVTKAARQADLINGANYYTAAELAAEAVIDEVTRLNPSL